MKKFRAFIFDLDGTLANTIPDLKFSMNAMLSDSGLPLQDDAGILKAINYGAYEFVRRCLPEKYRDNEDYVKSRLEIYTSYYDSHHIEGTKVYDGLKDVVIQLKKEGYRLGVLSNKQDDHCKDVVYNLFGKDLFDYVLGQTELPTKPSPVSAFVVAGHLDARPSEIIYVGDSHVDMITANNAGMFACGVCWGYRSEDILKENGAKITVHKPNELLKIDI